eukprot:Seg532.6 transcript_id=Seg532.6/GoldUCD/mRNA.D3Y31 product="hypothetical protein" protein_id=Seg532.6/GoldUCD/D3Y31
MNVETTAFDSDEDFEHIYDSEYSISEDGHGTSSTGRWMGSLTSLRSTNWGSERAKFSSNVSVCSKAEREEKVDHDDSGDFEIIDDIFVQADRKPAGLCSKEGDSSIRTSAGLLLAQAKEHPEKNNVTDSSVPKLDVKEAKLRLKHDTSTSIDEEFLTDIRKRHDISTSIDEDVLCKQQETLEKIDKNETFELDDKHGATKTYVDIEVADVCLLQDKAAGSNRSRIEEDLHLLVPLKIEALTFEEHVVGNKFDANVNNACCKENSLVTEEFIGSIEAANEEVVWREESLAEDLGNDESGICLMQSIEGAAVENSEENERGNISTAEKHPIIDKSKELDFNEIEQELHILEPLEMEALVLNEHFDADTSDVREKDSIFQEEGVVTEACIENSAAADEMIALGRNSFTECIRNEGNENNLEGSSVVKLYHDNEPRSVAITEEFSMIAKSMEQDIVETEQQLQLLEPIKMKTLVLKEHFDVNTNDTSNKSTLLQEENVFTEQCIESIEEPQDFIARGRESLSECIGHDENEENSDKRSAVQIYHENEPESVAINEQRLVIAKSIEQEINRTEQELQLLEPIKMEPLVLNEHFDVNTSGTNVKDKMLKEKGVVGEACIDSFEAQKEMIAWGRKHFTESIGNEENENNSGSVIKIYHENESENVATTEQFSLIAKSIEQDICEAEQEWQLLEPIKMEALVIEDNFVENKRTTNIAGVSNHKKRMAVETFIYCTQAADDEMFWKEEKLAEGSGNGYEGENGWKRKFENSGSQRYKEDVPEVMGIAERDPHFEKPKVRGCVEVNQPSHLLEPIKIESLTLEEHSLESVDEKGATKASNEDETMVIEAFIDNTEQLDEGVSGWQGSLMRSAGNIKIEDIEDQSVFDPEITNDIRKTNDRNEELLYGTTCHDRNEILATASMVVTESNMEGHENEAFKERGYESTDFVEEPGHGKGEVINDVKYVFTTDIFHRDEEFDVASIDLQYGIDEKFFASENGLGEKLLDCFDTSVDKGETSSKNPDFTLEVNISNTDVSFKTNVLKENAKICEFSDDDSASESNDIVSGSMEERQGKHLEEDADIFSDGGDDKKAEILLKNYKGEKMRREASRESTDEVQCTTTLVETDEIAVESAFDQTVVWREDEKMMREASLENTDEDRHAGTLVETEEIAVESVSENELLENVASEEGEKMMREASIETTDEVRRAGTLVETEEIAVESAFEREQFIAGKDELPENVAPEEDEKMIRETSFESTDEDRHAGTLVETEEIAVESAFEREQFIVGKDELLENVAPEEDEKMIREASFESTDEDRHAGTLVETEGIVVESAFEREQFIAGKDELPENVAPEEDEKIIRETSFESTDEDRCAGAFVETEETPVESAFEREQFIVGKDELLENVAPEEDEKMIREANLESTDEDRRAGTLGETEEIAVENAFEREQFIVGKDELLENVFPEEDENRRLYDDLVSKDEEKCHAETSADKEEFRIETFFDQQQFIESEDEMLTNVVKEEIENRRPDDNLAPKDEVGLQLETLADKENVSIETHVKKQQCVVTQEEMLNNLVAGGGKSKKLGENLAAIEEEGRHVETLKEEEEFCIGTVSDDQQVIESADGILKTVGADRDENERPDENLVAVEEGDCLHEEISPQTEESSIETATDDKQFIENEEERLENIVAEGFEKSQDNNLTKEEVRFHSETLAEKEEFCVEIVSDSGQNANEEDKVSASVNNEHKQMKCELLSNASRKEDLNKVILAEKEESSIGTTFDFQESTNERDAFLESVNIEHKQMKNESFSDVEREADLHGTIVAVNIDTSIGTTADFVQIVKEDDNNSASVSNKNEQMKNEFMRNFVTEEDLQRSIVAENDESCVGTTADCEQGEKHEQVSFANANNDDKQMKDKVLCNPEATEDLYEETIIEQDVSGIESSDLDQNIRGDMSTGHNEFTGQHYQVTKNVASCEMQPGVVETKCLDESELLSTDIGEQKTEEDYCVVVRGKIKKHPHEGLITTKLHGEFHCEQQESFYDEIKNVWISNGKGVQSIVYDANSCQSKIEGISFDEGLDLKSEDEQVASSDVNSPGRTIFEFEERNEGIAKDRGNKREERIPSFVTWESKSAKCFSSNKVPSLEDKDACMFSVELDPGKRKVLKIDSDEHKVDCKENEQQLERIAFAEDESAEISRLLKEDLVWKTEDDLLDYLVLDSPVKDNKSNANYERNEDVESKIVNFVPEYERRSADPFCNEEEPTSVTEINPSNEIAVIKEDIKLVEKGNKRATEDYNIAKSVTTSEKREKPSELEEEIVNKDGDIISKDDDGSFVYIDMISLETTKSQTTGQQIERGIRHDKFAYAAREERYEDSSYDQEESVYQAERSVFKDENEHLNNASMKMPVETFLEADQDKEEAREMKGENKAAEIDKDENIPILRTGKQHAPENMNIADGTSEVMEANDFDSVCQVIESSSTEDSNINDFKLDSLVNQSLVSASEVSDITTDNSSKEIYLDESEHDEMEHQVSPANELLENLAGEKNENISEGKSHAQNGAVKDAPAISEGINLTNKALPLVETEEESQEVKEPTEQKTEKKVGQLVEEDQKRQSRSIYEIGKDLLVRIFGGGDASVTVPSAETSAGRNVDVERSGLGNALVEESQIEMIAEKEDFEETLDFKESLMKECDLIQTASKEENKGKTGVSHVEEEIVEEKEVSSVEAIAGFEQRLDKEGDLLQRTSEEEEDDGKCNHMEAEEEFHKKIITEEEDLNVGAIAGFEQRFEDKEGAMLQRTSEEEEDDGKCNHMGEEEEFQKDIVEEEEELGVETAADFKQLFDEEGGLLRGTSKEDDGKCNDMEEEIKQEIVGEKEELGVETAADFKQLFDKEGGLLRGTSKEDDRKCNDMEEEEGFGKEIIEKKEELGVEAAADFKKLFDEKGGLLRGTSKEDDRKCNDTEEEEFQKEIVEEKEEPGVETAADSNQSVKMEGKVTENTNMEEDDLKKEEINHEELGKDLQPEMILNKEDLSLGITAEFEKRIEIEDEVKKEEINHEESGKDLQPEMIPNKEDLSLGITAEFEKRIEIEVKKEEINHEELGKDLQPEMIPNKEDLSLGITAEFEKIIEIEDEVKKEEINHEELGKDLQPEMIPNKEDLSLGITAEFEKIIEIEDEVKKEEINHEELEKDLQPEIIPNKEDLRLEISAEFEKRIEIEDEVKKEEINHEELGQDLQPEMIPNKEDLCLGITAEFEKRIEIEDEVKKEEINHEELGKDLQPEMIPNKEDLRLGITAEFEKRIEIEDEVKKEEINHEELGKDLQPEMIPNKEDLSLGIKAEFEKRIEIEDEVKKEEINHEELGKDFQPEMIPNKEDLSLGITAEFEKRIEIEDEVKKEEINHEELGKDFQPEMIPNKEDLSLGITAELEIEDEVKKEEINHEELEKDLQPEIIPNKEDLRLGISAEFEKRIEIEDEVKKEEINHEELGQDLQPEIANKEDLRLGISAEFEKRIENEDKVLQNPSKEKEQGKDTIDLVEFEEDFGKEKISDVETTVELDKFATKEDKMFLKTDNEVNLDTKIEEACPGKNNEATGILPEKEEVGIGKGADLEQSVEIGVDLSEKTDIDTNDDRSEELNLIDKEEDLNIGGLKTEQETSLEICGEDQSTKRNDEQLAIMRKEESKSNGEYVNKEALPGLISNEDHWVEAAHDVEKYSEEEEEEGKSIKEEGNAMKSEACDVIEQEEDKDAVLFTENGEVLKFEQMADKEEKLIAREVTDENNNMNEEIDGFNERQNDLCGIFVDKEEKSIVIECNESSSNSFSKDEEIIGLLDDKKKPWDAEIIRRAGESTDISKNYAERPIISRFKKRAISISGESEINIRTKNIYSNLQSISFQVGSKTPEIADTLQKFEISKQSGRGPNSAECNQPSCSQRSEIVDKNLSPNVLNDFNNKATIMKQLTLEELGNDKEDSTVSSPTSLDIELASPSYSTTVKKRLSLCFFERRKQCFEEERHLEASDATNEETAGNESSLDSREGQVLNDGEGNGCISNVNVILKRECTGKEGQEYSTNNREGVQSTKDVITQGSIITEESGSLFSRTERLFSEEKSVQRTDLASGAAETDNKVEARKGLIPSPFILFLLWTT